MSFFFTGVALQAGTDLDNVGLWVFYPDFSLSQFIAYKDRVFFLFLFS